MLVLLKTNNLTKMDQKIIDQKSNINTLYTLVLLISIGILFEPIHVVGRVIFYQRTCKFDTRRMNSMYNFLQF